MKNLSLTLAALIVLLLVMIFASANVANKYMPKIAYEKNDSSAEDMHKCKPDMVWGLSEDSDLKILQKHHETVLKQMRKIDSLIKVKRK